jgi:ubiquinone/menaquinone biosynthesis C-methylase UbiE
MLKHASLLASADVIQNAHFIGANACERLPFNNESLGYVQLRHATSFLGTEAWSLVLKECRRTLRKGRYVRVADLRSMHSNMPDYDQFSSILPQVMAQMHRTFAPHGHSFGIPSSIPNVLRSLVQNPKTCCVMGTNVPLLNQHEERSISYTIGLLILHQAMRISRYPCTY